MKTLRIALVALATILAVGISSNTYAFMSVDEQPPVEVQSELSTMVESLRAEMEAGETACKDMLAKLDEALDTIDAKLDEGVENEEEYLKARDEITSMRAELECIADQLTRTFGSSEGRAPAGGGQIAASTAGTNVVSGGGGAGGSSANAGGAASGVAMAGAIAGTAAAGAQNRNSNPGFIASGSSTN